MRQQLKTTRLHPQTPSLERRVADLENTLRFIRDQCTWEPAIKGHTTGGGDDRIGPAIDSVLADGLDS